MDCKSGKEISNVHKCAGNSPDKMNMSELKQEIETIKHCSPKAQKNLFYCNVKFKIQIHDYSLLCLSV